MGLTTLHKPTRTTRAMSSPFMATDTTTGLMDWYQRLNRVATNAICGANVVTSAPANR